MPTEKLCFDYNPVLRRSGMGCFPITAMAMDEMPKTAISKDDEEQTPLTPEIAERAIRAILEELPEEDRERVLQAAGAPSNQALDSSLADSRYRLEHGHGRARAMTAPQAASYAERFPNSGRLTS